MTTVVLGLLLIAATSVASGYIGSLLQLPLWLTGLLGGGAALAAIRFVLPLFTV
jgi:hypothetical protein